MRSLFSAAMIVVFSAVAMVAQNNGEREPAHVAGKWELTLESPHGAMQFALHVKQDGSKISGTAERDGKAHPLTGSVQQKQISFSFEPRQGATLAFKGTVGADKMSGTAEPPHGGAFSWTAKRAAAGEQSAQAAMKPIAGTVTEFKADSLEIGIKPEHGGASFVRFGPETEVVRVAPGEVNLTKAEPVKLTDIAYGDRVLVSFVAGMTEARRIVVILATDIAKRDETERLERTSVPSELADSDRLQPALRRATRSRRNVPTRCGGSAAVSRQDRSR